MGGLDLAKVVTCEECDEAPPAGAPAPDLHVVALDFGVKRNILRCLVDTGFRVTVVPARTSAKEILTLAPDGVFLSNGPGDPAAVTYAMETIRDLLGKKPDLRHLPGAPAARARARPARRTSSSSATAAPTSRSRICVTGRRGDHHAEPRLLRGPATLPGSVVVTQFNLNDGTVEGSRPRQRPAFTVQYHPEASPGRTTPVPVRPLPGRDRCQLRAGETVMPRREDIQQDPHHRLRAHRDRPGVRVRLLRHAGLQGPARRGLRGRAGQLQPGHDHDRPRDGRRARISNR